MRFFAVVLTLSVGLGCAGTRSSRDANSPDDENNEEINQTQSDEETAPAAEAEGDDREEQAESRPAKKRRPPKRRRQVEEEEEEPPPVARASKPPPPVEAPPDEPAPAFSEPAEPGPDALELEARRRCHWKNVPPYRPEWANSITPPVQRKITSKPICPYGTPPAVLRVARQIAVQQTKFKR